MTIEQMVRDVLTACKRDLYLMDLLRTDCDPQRLTGGELVYPANALAECLRELNLPPREIGSMGDV